MTEDTAGSFPNESRHVSVWADVTAATAYAFISDPENLPRWVAGLDLSAVAFDFAQANELGVLDHVVRVGGEEFYNAMRVIAPMVGQQPCELVFTVRRRSGMTDEEFEADAAAVEADLATLRGLLEN